MPKSGSFGRVQRFRRRCRHNLNGERFKMKRRPAAGEPDRRRSGSVGLLSGPLAVLLFVGGCSTDATRPVSSATPTSTAPTSRATPSSDASTLPAPVTGSIAHRGVGFPPSGVVKTTIYDTTGDYPAFEIGWDTAGQYLVVIIRGSSSCHGDVERIAKTGDQAVTIDVSPGPPPETTCLADQRVPQRCPRPAGDCSQ